ncbi:DNA repair protein RadC [Paenibacillus sp. GCM10027626]|uniref:RadC family protein n=1 Tax=Paenibacillus sp. GCM10027626 TaxID=3273411 RepID=UPI003628C5A6
MNKYDNDTTTFKSLVAASLCEKQGSYLIEELFQRFPDKNAFMDATEQELIQIKGIGVGKAQQIISLIQLTQILSKPKRIIKIIKSPNDVYELLAPEVQHLNKEHFVALLLNTKNHLIAKEIISIGSLNATIAHPREVFHKAIRHSSASVIAVHNHPSGDPQPSYEDIEITRRLAEAGEIIGIELLDHVVIGEDRYVSLKEKGHM